MKRTPAIYGYYESNILKAYREDNYDYAEELIKDAPKDVYKALIKNDIIEGSVEQTRDWEEEYIREQLRYEEGEVE